MREDTISLEEQMMKKILAVLLLVILAALPLAASAGASLTESRPLERTIYMSRGTNCYYARVDGGYQLFDAAGVAISAVYGNITTRQDGAYYVVVNENGLNTQGLLDAQGREILPLAYGDITVVDDRWVLACVLEKTDADTGDMKDRDGNMYLVTRTDVVFDGRMIGSLTREEFRPSYSYTGKGPYLAVRIHDEAGYWLDGSFNRVELSGEYFSYSEFDGATHVPTQQTAFAASCTLTPADVTNPYKYEYDYRAKSGTLVDLQGNVLITGAPYDSLAYYGGDYLISRLDGRKGVIRPDGTEILATEWESLGGDYDGKLFLGGYQAVLDEKGNLYFLNLNGEVTASAEYGLSSSDYKGLNYNSPIITIKNLNKVMIVTATKGQLAQTYDEASTPRGARVLSVRLGDNWGVIDMDGNEVVPFVHRAALEISEDGTLAYGSTQDRVYMLYRISFDGEGAVAAVTATPAPAAEGGWVCPGCSAENSGKFCTSCGSAKPTPTPEPTAEPTPVPAADGPWVCPGCATENSGKFCTECGTARPEAAPAEIVCGSCGYDPDGETPKFCPNCGTKF